MASQALLDYYNSGIEEERLVRNHRKEEIENRSRANPSRR
jgi:hypothetical protein